MKLINPDYKLTAKKEKYIQECANYLLQKIKSINGILNETQSSANSDTKSSAGDKHETSRAMAHLENERLGGQMVVLQSQLEKIYSINPSAASPKVAFGSIVTCKSFTFFVSTGIGKIKQNGLDFFAIAKESPVGYNLINKTVGDTIKVGNITETIQRIG